MQQFNWLVRLVGIWNFASFQLEVISERPISSLIAVLRLKPNASQQIIIKFVAASIKLLYSWRGAWLDTRKKWWEWTNHACTY